MIVFPNAGPNRNRPGPGRFAMLAAGAVVAVGTGTLLVKAADNPRVHAVVSGFNQPIRMALEPLVRRQERSLAEVQRERERRGFELVRPVVTPEAERMGQSRSMAAAVPNLPPRQPVVLPVPALPQMRVPAPPPAPLAAPRAVPRQADLAPAPTPEPRGRYKLQSRGTGAGMAVATNYCVRLCDGFAFPVGEAGNGQQAQEVACRQACPGAQTTLYTLPAGAQDLSVLNRGGTPYTALPTAFRYQRQVSDACSCKPVGSTQSANAFYRDMTLRPGDVIMTGSGAQHFDGASRFPYKPTHFGEAVKRLTLKKEVAVVRAMEAASVRGIFSPAAPPSVRARVVADLQKAAQKAEQEAPNPSPAPHPRGFVDLHERAAEGRVALPVVRRAPGLVALN